MYLFLGVHPKETHVGLVKLDGYQCERCEHTWLPRERESYGKELPKVCPRCKSPYWNKPRQRGVKVTEPEVRSPEAKPRQRTARSAGG